MDQKQNSTETTTTTRSWTPIVAYEFPCSYLGKPRPIQSLLSLSPLGSLEPPIRPHSQASNLQNRNHLNDDSVVLSCPRRTVDGISSETILESEKSVKSLQSHTNDQSIDSQNRILNALAVEIWFTPFLQEAMKKESDTQFLPLLSIAEPLAPVGGRKSPTGSDPCERTQLMIGQRGEFLELFYRDHYEYLPESFFDFDDDFIHRHDDVQSPQYSCRILRLTQWKLGKENIDREPEAIQGLQHLVVGWKKSGSVLQIFANGKPIVSIDVMSGDENIEVNTDSDFIRHWDPTYRLHVFSDSSRRNYTSESTDYTETEATLSGLNNMDAKTSFPGSIHEIALFQQDFDEDAIETLYESGLKKRKDPFHAFFEDDKNPFEPLLLVAAPTLSHSDERQLDNDISSRGVVVTQGNSALISVGAEKSSNTTTTLWDVLVEILELPAYGELIYNETKESIEGPKNYSTVYVGDRFLLEEGELRVYLEYQHLEEDYFSVPKYSYNGTRLPMADLPTEFFSYRLIAVKKATNENNSEYLEPSSFLLGSSKAVRQELTIVHKNHPPVLVGLPIEVVQPERQPSRIGSRPWATLGSNVFLNDEKDYDINRVRLDFWAEKGTLTIDLQDSEIQASAEITDCSNPVPTGLGGEWICSGRNDRNSTLLATPTGISRILSNLKYNAFNWDTSDSIVLRIYDGSGGLCPDKTNHYHTIGVDECYSITAIVEVPPMSRTEGGPSTGSVWREHRAWWISLVVFLAILSTTCCCAIGCWRRLRRIKKLNDIAVSDLGRSSVVLASPEEGFPSNLGITEEDRRIAAISLNQKRDQKNADSAV